MDENSIGPNADTPSVPQPPPPPGYAPPPPPGYAPPPPGYAPPPPGYAPPAPPTPPATSGQIPQAPPPLQVYPGNYPAPGSSKDGFAIASLITGILSLLGCCVWYLTFFLAVAAIICGVIGMKSTKRGLAIAGLVIGIVGLLSAIAMGIYSIYLIANPDFYQELTGQTLPVY